MKQQKLNGKTHRFFDEDPYMKTFKANVISCTECGGEYLTLLDATTFFPEAGGQPSDTGTITLVSDGTVLNVKEVRENGGELLHVTEKPVPCGKIIGSIDFKKRYERMRNHSGEHLLSGFAHTMFGCTNVGFHLNDKTVTVDLDKHLTAEQLLQIEEAVNDVIAENIRITSYYPQPAELAELDYRSKLELTENVRIVEIGEYDRCACCAPHVSSTAEIGMLVITDSISYKGGTRLNMVCGKNAFKASRQALTNVREISGQLSSKPSETAIAVARFIRQTEEENAKAAAMCGAYIALRVDSIAPTDGNIVIFEPDLDRNSLRRLVDRAADKCGGICAGFCGSDEDGWSYVLISRTVDLKAEAKLLNEKMNGRGGGTSRMIQGSVSAPRAVLKNIF